MATTLADLLQQEATISPSRDWLWQELEGIATQSTASIDQTMVREQLDELMQSINHWNLDEFGKKKLRKRMARLFKRAQKKYRVALADGTAESYHRWRKHHKRYYLLLKLFKQSDRRTRKAFKKLGALLGELHDLQVLQHQVAARWPESLAEVRAVTEPAQQQRLKTIKQQAKPLYGPTG